MITRRPWTYGCDIKNRGYLQSDEPFQSIIEELSGALKAGKQSDVRFRMEPSNNRYGGDDPLMERLKCTRASWAIRIDLTLLDKFFNGRMGIRAQYYMSPYHGRDMNSLLLSALHEQLTGFAVDAVPLVDRTLVSQSLTGTSAKAWISEVNLAGEKIIRASDLTLTEEELQNDWLDLARAVKSGALGFKHYQLYAAAINGVRAPMADQLEIKGAWITNRDRCEYVAVDKRDRDCQLFMFGFS